MAMSWQKQKVWRAAGLGRYLWLAGKTCKWKGPVGICRWRPKILSSKNIFVSLHWVFSEARWFNLRTHGGATTRPCIRSRQIPCVKNRWAEQRQEGLTGPILVISIRCRSRISPPPPSERLALSTAQITAFAISVLFPLPRFLFLSVSVLCLTFSFLFIVAVALFLVF